jgi:hypothetical protein
VVIVAAQINSDGTKKLFSEATAIIFASESVFSMTMKIVGGALTVFVPTQQNI